MPLPTLDDLKDHLDKSRTNHDDDGELVDMLDAAVDVVEGIAGPITARTITEVLRVGGAEALVLRHSPVAEVVSLASGYGSSLLSVDLSELYVSADAGLIRRMDGSGFSGAYTVTYSAGRPTVPGSIRLAVLIIAAHLWETQRGTSPSALALQDPDAAFGPPSVAGYAIPNRARDLLARYVQPTIA